MDRSANPLSSQPLDCTRRTGLRPRPPAALPTSASPSLTSSPSSPTRKPPPFKSTFDATLYSDLANAGIFDIVSKSLHAAVHSRCAHRDQPCPVVQRTHLRRHGRLRSLGVRAAKSRQRLPLRREKHAIPAGSRQAIQRGRQRRLRPPDRPPLRRRNHLPSRRRRPRHRRDQDLLRQNRRRQQRDLAMDYDGANQHAITHLGTISISPRVSPDNTRLAFSSLGHDGFQIRMFSLLLGRMVNFPPRRHQPLPGLGSRRQRDRLLLLAHRRPRDLDLRRQRQSLRAASPASAAPTSHPSTTQAPAHRSPGSAAAPAFPSSTSWTPTAPPSPA